MDYGEVERTDFLGAGWEAAFKVTWIKRIRGSWGRAACYARGLKTKKAKGEVTVSGTYAQWGLPGVFVTFPVLHTAAQLRFL